MDKKILNLVQAKPKSVSLIDPNKKVNRGYVLRFNYGSEVVDGKRKQIRKDAYLKVSFNHFPKNAFDRQQNTQAGKEANIIFDAVKSDTQILPDATQQKIKNNQIVLFGNGVNGGKVPNYREPLP